jgi:hypothetical protein
MKNARAKLFQKLQFFFREIVALETRAIKVSKTTKKIS